VNVIILGGARTLISDIKKCPTDTVKISVNHHGVNAFECDYMVYFHDVALELIKYSDVELIDIKTNRYKMFSYASTSAITFALYELEANKVYLAGFDLYQSTYFHSSSYDQDQRPTGYRYPMNKHIQVWDEYLRALGDFKYKLVPISGPLVELCKR